MVFVSRRNVSNKKNHMVMLKSNMKNVFTWCQILFIKKKSIKQKKKRLLHYFKMIKCCLYPEGINQTEEKMSGYVNLLKWCLYQEEYNQTEEEIFIYMLIYL